MKYLAVLTYYDSYLKPGNGLGLYGSVEEKTIPLGVGIFNILLTAGVYISATAVIVSAILLMVASRGNSTKLSESKKGIIKTLLVSIAMFTVTGLIALIQGVAIH